MARTEWIFHLPFSWTTRLLLVNPRTRLQPAAAAGAPRALLALAAEDHYLRVNTDRGEDQILRRFGDALDDIAGLDGTQVHRGWWVARDAVIRHEREGGRTLLILSNDARVPVSRTCLRSMREAGLLET